MAVERLEITRRVPYAEGREFGEVGAYERIDGIAHFSIDPLSGANATICDIERAERGADGHVHFTADFTILAPADPGRGKRRLLFEVVNRGRKLIPRNMNMAMVDAATDVDIAPGDGYLFRNGWTVAWCGWQWDTPRGPALVGLDAPTTLEGGRPIEAQVLCEHQLSAPAEFIHLGNRQHTALSAVALDDPRAMLTVRDSRYGERSIVPRERWRFAKAEGGRVVASHDHAWLEGGFIPGKLYEIIYHTRTSPLVGAGLLAVRDFSGFLRFEGDGNPCAGALDRAYAFGISQSARFLRHFLYLGMNVDERGRQVYDGVFPHVGGGRRGEFNQRAGQTSVQSAPNFGHVPPYADDGLFARQRWVGGMPKVILTNTAAEYWRGDCSLLHTDIEGKRDHEPSPDVRTYLFASTQHGSGAVPLGHVNTGDGGWGANWFNSIDYSPLIRAALVNLDRWASEGVEPPANVYPRLDDGTAVDPTVALASMPAIPSATMPRPDLVPRVRHLDLGPGAAHGVGRYPLTPGEPFTIYVSAVDADGNEVGGIRLPDVAVPLATYTGWNPRHADSGGSGQIIPMQGSVFAFPRDRAERERTGDPRASIAERYASREDYLARARQVAEGLVQQRHLLAEDVDLLVNLAAGRYDFYTTSEQPRTPPAVKVAIPA